MNLTSCANGNKKALYLISFMSPTGTSTAFFFHKEGDQAISLLRRSQGVGEIRQCQIEIARLHNGRC